MTKLPKITLITPSLNQEKFIGKTIESVVSQRYPNLEYIVMDGGSNDGTINILKRYSKKLIWFSQKDRGQSHAINKGIRKATGEIVGYLNSDDYFERDTLWLIGEHFAQNPNVYWLTGKCHIVDEKNKEIEKLIQTYKNFFLKHVRKLRVFYITQFISQPATFWRRKIIKEIGYFNEKLHFSMDYDYWIRIWHKYELNYLDKYLANYRIHSFSKARSYPEKQFSSSFDILKSYTSSPFILFPHRIHNYLALCLYRLFRG